MPVESLPARDVVLIGAGHTNLHIIRQWRMRPLPGVRLTLVSPFSRATYSGMLPGTLAGLYQPEEMQIDLYRFTAGTGIRLIVAEATGLQPAGRLVTFADRVPIRFDIAAVGIGSVPSRHELWRQSARVLSIKPMATFLPRLETATARYRQAGSSLRCVIVGSGAAGAEIAFCLEAWLKNKGSAATATPPLTKGGQGMNARPQTPAPPTSHQITLLDSHTEILPGYTPALVRRARTLLAERGIQVQLGQRAESLDEAATGEANLRLTDGTLLPADLIIWATNASPPEVLDGFDLPKTDDGFLAVRSTLQTTAEAPVFVVGDTASFVDQRVPKAGVYAVREGPILWDNIQNLLAGRPLKSYHPQRGFLSLLSTGDGQALLQYQGWTLHGRWAFRLKDHIDRKFIRMYQEYRPPVGVARPEGTPLGVAGAVSNLPTPFGVPQGVPPTVVSKMHCGGCGSKVGADVLTPVLNRLRETFPQATWALRQPDDAYVVPADAIRPEVLSIDFFRAFLDDPYLMGRIAVLHALSDIWAMGAVPLGVQAIITLPYGPPEAQSELLFQLLAGATRELAANGAELWGGHTLEGPELQLGFSVSGHLKGEMPWRKSGLRPGDSLVLTKRLGTGTLLAAHQMGLCRAEWFDQLLVEMLVSNRVACEIARQFPIHAATDVTGFGVAGHLLEMLGPGCQAMLDPRQLEHMLLPGFHELTLQGIASSLAPANDKVFKAALMYDTRVNHPEHTEIPALVDPQTSGGLLFGVPEDSTRDLLFALRDAGYPVTVIGMVIAEKDWPQKLVFEWPLEFPSYQPKGKPRR